MPRNIDDFWKILSEIQGNTTDLTEPVKAIAHNEQATIDRFMNNVVDQISYNSADWTRIKAFITDWCAAHRTVSTYQSNISDIYEIPNDQLDELFRSFGYPYSASIKDSTSNEPPQNKINFFLDLVNLYKIKGTPQALLDVFKYYGISDLDIYEFQLQLEERTGKNNDDLIFKGQITVGTSGDTSPIYLPFKFLTENDPHWFQTESQIRELLANNNINFPSTTPYFAVKPVFDEEAIDAATGMLVRRVQDQHDLWEDSGLPSENSLIVLPQDAVITILGETTSMLTLYLACIYTFNKEFYVGAPASRFICYDGTNVVSANIMDEFRHITGRKIFTREEWKERWEEYLDTFSRIISDNFLQVSTDAGDVLGNLNPNIKNDLDNLAADNIEVLGTLLTDLGEWVRNNISYGFINLSYILFGLDSFFGQMSDVVDFFKPYRARLIPLEQLQFRNRLFNSIIINDELKAISVELDVHDFVTGDGVPCLVDSTASLFYARETYDCNSYFDIGAVTDISQDVFIEVYDDIRDRLACPLGISNGISDSTAAVYIASNAGAPEAPIVTSNLTEFTYQTHDITNIEAGSNTLVGYHKETQISGYSLTLNLFNTIDSTIEFYSHIITEKNLNSYTAKISGTPTTSNYYMSADYDNSEYSGIAHIPDGTNEIKISVLDSTSPLPAEIDSTGYTVAVSLSNLVDANPSTYNYTITKRTETYFKVLFSDNMDSNNYYLDWIIISHPKQGVEELSIAPGITTRTIAFTPAEVNTNYGVMLELLNDVDSTSVIIPFIVTEKTITGFTVTFEREIDTDNYKLMWSLPFNSSLEPDEYKYYQTGQFVNFDGVPLESPADSTGNVSVYVEGTQTVFDCSYGRDIVDIEISDSESFLLWEGVDGIGTEGFLTQENDSPTNDSRILL